MILQQTVIDILSFVRCHKLFWSFQKGRVDLQATSELRSDGCHGFEATGRQTPENALKPVHLRVEFSLEGNLWEA